MRGAAIDAAAGEATHDALLSALADPATYGTTQPVSVVETHISWVFVTGQRAYKLKKPMVLDFVDYGTPARRRLMCRREVDLNRRLAPTVYLGVRSVIRLGSAWALGPEGHPEAVDHVVEMRRFDERRTLAAVLEAEGDPRIGEVADIVASFHRRGRITRPEAVLFSWRQIMSANVAHLIRLAPLHRERLIAQERFALAFLAGDGGQEIERRRDAGLVRDGHGDLRCDHVVLEDEISVVDCLEFDPGLREIDVGADLAYLLADLEHRGQAAHAFALRAAYERAGGDCGDESLLRFFCAYRALVAAKVGILRGLDAASPRILTWLNLADTCAWRARLAPVTVVCGVSGSGKSTLAEQLARASGLAVVSSDRVRKEMLGRALTDRLGAEGYTQPISARVYARMGSLAAERVRGDGGVVVDATFARQELRDAFAAGLGAAPARYLLCGAPRQVLRERIRRRTHASDRVSDADEAVLERQLAAWDAFEITARVVPVETDRPLAALAAATAEALDADLATVARG